MSFLDGLLVRDNPSIILKAVSVEDNLYERLEQNTSELRPYTFRSIQTALENAKEQFRQAQKDTHIQLEKTRVEEIQGEIPTPTGNEVKEINDDVIMSALWQIKNYLEDDLFRKLQSLFHKEVKEQQLDRPINKPEELVLNQFLNQVEKGNKISETLQNNMFDKGLLDGRFLLIIEDVAKRGQRKLHPRLYDKLVSLESGEAKPSDIYYKAIRVLEQLTGRKTPDKDAILQELNDLIANKQRSVSDVMSLLNSKQYVFRGRESQEDLKKIRNKIDNLLEGNWDKALDYFYRTYDIKNENGEVTETEHHWGTQNLDDELQSEWNSIKDKTSISFEDIRGKKYMAAIYELEEQHANVDKYFKAFRRLNRILEEKQVVEPDIDYSLKHREEEFNNQYKNVVDAVENYSTYKKEIIKDIQEKQRQHKKFIAQRRKDPLYDPSKEEQPISEEGQEHLSNLETMREENLASKRPNIKQQKLVLANKLKEKLKILIKEGADEKDIKQVRLQIKTLEGTL